MEPPTKEEIQILEDVRTIAPYLRFSIKDLQLPEEDLTDKNLIRFLRARNGNVKATEQMIRNNRNWQLAEDVQGLLANYEAPKTWEDAFHYEVVGFDKTGCPIGWAPFGNWDIQKEMVLGNKEEFIKYVHHHMEKLMTMLKLLSKDENHLKQIVGIVDLEGLSFRQVTSLDVVECAVRCLKTFEANYPETVKAAVVVNAPWAFQLIWKIVKPFLSEHTHSKLEFVGSDREKWKEAILRLAEPDQFPKSYGGQSPNSKQYFVARDGSWTCSENQNECDEKVSIGGNFDFASNSIIKLD